MDKESKADRQGVDGEDIIRARARIAERSRRAVSDFLDRQSRDTGLAALFDPLHIGDAFLQMTAQILASPARLVEAQMSLWSNYLQLWQHTARSMMGEEPAEPPPPAREWNRAELLDFIQQSFLLSARWIHGLLRANGQAEADARMVDFYTRQFSEAMTPERFFAANPDFLDAVSASQGESLTKGLDHLLAELERGKTLLAGSEEPHRRRAASPGKSVFRNSAMELLHYAPATAEVHATPLLIIPPWNARHYLVDLEPASSLVKWAIERGHTVFALSWAPAEGELAQRRFEDTLRDGPLAALDAIAALTGEKRVNGLGFGLGGTLLAASLAALSARGEDRFASATYLGTQLDFAEPGELSVFIDEEALRVLDLERDDKEPADIRALTATSGLLRANDVIWSFVADCLEGARPPLPVEALRCIADSLPLASATQDFYLRALYQRNLLAEPGGVMLHGAPLDLSGVTVPAYVLAGREDRLTPWHAAFAATRLFSGPTRFVLAPSGHVGSMSATRGHWINERRINERKARNPEIWLDHAIRQDGSWREDWARWLAPFSGPIVPARAPKG